MFELAKFKFFLRFGCEERGRSHLSLGSSLLLRIIFWLQKFYWGGSFPLRTYLESIKLITVSKLTATLCLAFLVLLWSEGAGASDDYQKGLDAYRSGDYVSAVRIWTILAEQGDADAQSSLINMEPSLVSKEINECHFDEIEKFCRRKLKKKSLNFLLRKSN